MATDRWERIVALFDRALKTPPPERAAVIRNSGEPADVQDEVLALIASHGDSEGFLEPPALLAPGTQVGAYRIERILGRGGMGVVYLAHDTRLHRPVALKSLPPHLFRDERMHSRLRQEARAAAALAHPGDCHRLRPRTDRRSAVHCARVSRGRHAARGDRRRPHRHRARDRGGHRHRPCADRRPRTRHRPSRSETREHHCHRERQREGGGLRPRAVGRRRTGSRIGDAADGSRERWRARRPTWLRSSCSGSRPVHEPINLPSACCSTNCSPADTRSAAASCRRRSPGSCRPNLEPAGIDESLWAVITRATQKQPEDRFPTMKELLSALHPWHQAPAPRHEAPTRARPEAGGRPTN